MEKNSNKPEAVKKLKQLVSDVEMAMLTTKDEQGAIYARPMATIEVDEDGNIWFFTNEFSEKVEQVSENNELNLIYSHPGKNTYINIFGIATIVRDREKMQQLWTPAVKAWFPDGIDDPRLCLLKVDTKEAWFWDNNSSKMVIFFQMLKAIVAGKQFDEGETGSLKL